ncbi:hypothetical protein GF352_00415 [archaeon]|nr:hypothetical protein [archaeon]
MLNVSDSLNFLKIKGLPVVKTVKISSLNGLRTACKKLGYPLVLKLDSPEHKTEKGWVVTDLNSLNEAEKAFKRLVKKGEIVLQPQVDGIELSLGIKKDPVFKQVVMFGLGGVFIELFKDVVFKVCPINKNEAKKMIKELKAIDLLKGYRGGKVVNLDLLANIITRLSRIAVKEDIKELDVNPLIAVKDNFKIVDARLRI